MPDGRTGHYAIWRACERFGLKPWEDWDDLPLDVKADMLAYNQIREHEEAEASVRPINALAKATNQRRG